MVKLKVVIPWVKACESSNVNANVDVDVDVNVDVNMNVNVNVDVDVDVDQVRKKAPRFDKKHRQSYAIIRNHTQSFSPDSIFIHSHSHSHGHSHSHSHGHSHSRFHCQTPSTLIDEIYVLVFSLTLGPHHPVVRIFVVAEE